MIVPSTLSFQDHHLLYLMVYVRVLSELAFTGTHHSISLLDTFVCP